MVVIVFVVVVLKKIGECGFMVNKMMWWRSGGGVDASGGYVVVVTNW